MWVSIKYKNLSNTIKIVEHACKWHVRLESQMHRKRVEVAVYQAE
jgi:hypothetical protein